MEPWTMLTVAGIVVVLPFVLAFAFNGRDRADVRGRRVNREWRPRRAAR